jgi:hypothetical protein
MKVNQMVGIKIFNRWNKQQSTKSIKYIIKQKSKYMQGAKKESTVCYTRKITALFTDISIKINRFVCIKQA